MDRVSQSQLGELERGKHKQLEDFVERTWNGLRKFCLFTQKEEKRAKIGKKSEFHMSLSSPQDKEREEERERDE